MRREKTARRNTLRDLFMGIGAGVAIAFLLCMYVFVLYIIRGNDAFESYDTTVGTVMLSYLLGGLLAGATLGLLMPITRWRWGAAAVGWIVAIPVFAIVHVAAQGHSSWNADDVLKIVFLAFFIGSPAGWFLWSSFRADEPVG